MKTRVFVTLKPDVLDPQGKAIEGALHRLGYTAAHGVRVGKVIEMNLDMPDAQLAKKQQQAPSRGGRPVTYRDGTGQRRQMVQIGNTRIAVNQPYRIRTGYEK